MHIYFKGNVLSRTIFLPRGIKFYKIAIFANTRKRDYLMKEDRLCPLVAWRSSVWDCKMKLI